VTRSPYARAALGLAVGFLGAFAVIQAVDRLGPSDRNAQAEMVLGVPDLNGYCARENDALRPLLVVADPNGWECAGPISNVWTSTAVNFDAVCQWQHDEMARARLVEPELPSGWRCVTDR
jgi:hypothetical protein